MVVKILQIIAIIILAILPFSTVLSNFSPYWTDSTFQHYLIASFVFAVVSLLLGLFVSKGKLFGMGFFFFFLGLLVAPPFMLGPPEESPKLLERITEEHFRYGLLLIASFVFALGFFSILKHFWSHISNTYKLIILPFLVCFVLLVWDNYSSYNFSSDLKAWISEGKNIHDFFPNYNFNEFLRTLGRSLIYVLIPWLGFILFKKRMIKKWQLIFLCIFSGIGVVFFFLTNFVGMEFYFPFMVPAVALAPAYWLGLMLIVNPRH